MSAPTACCSPAGTARGAGTRELRKPHTVPGRLARLTTGGTLWNHEPSRGRRRTRTYRNPFVEARTRAAAAGRTLLSHGGAVRASRPCAALGRGDAQRAGRLAGPVRGVPG